MDSTEKSSIIRLRLGSALKESFVVACKRSDSSIDPSTRLRMLMRDFVGNVLGITLNISVKIWKPDSSYDDGAYKVWMELGKKEREVYEKYKVLTFRIPRLPKRFFRQEQVFSKAVAFENNVELRGIFVKGVWESHVYTNGIPEAENPTSIKAVEIALYESVEDSLLPFICFERK
jgi:hypothetical protein